MMKRTFIVFTALAVLGLLAVMGYGGPRNASPVGQGPKVSSGPALSADIPPDVTVTGKPTLESLQHDFDVLSWESFVALNWPALPDGAPNRSKKIGEGGDAPTVWEAWKETYEIFLSDGGEPAAWGTPRKPPAACEHVYEDGIKTMQQVGKTPDVLDAFDQPFKTGPLVDQNGVYARFVINVNRPMFDYIVRHQLYNQQGQERFGQNNRVSFPCGSEETKAVGALMVKAAWKVVGEKDDPSRFHTVDALIYTPASENPKIEESCQKRRMALVGFHIGHKTLDAPQWIWSTFEQVDNDPTEGETPTREHYNFYNPDCQACPVNEPPPRPWDPNRGGPPSQVVRVVPIPEGSKALNREYQQALRDVDESSVWQFCELVSTQWPTEPGKACDQLPPTDPTGAPAPPFLANTTLETYVQGDKLPGVDSSCIDCHNNATTTAGKFSDFTYVLELARPRTASE
jgi:hypothetical protein